MHDELHILISSSGWLYLLLAQLAKEVVPVLLIKKWRYRLI